MSVSSVASKQTNPLQATIAVLMGNTLGWFDLAIYGFLAVTIAKVFFPTGNETSSVLLALGTFGVTFFTRPLGAIVIGSYSDRHGRKAALALTAGLTTAGSAVIALAPSYALAGIAAPILVVAARLLQGFASGGEFGSATAYLAESEPAHRGFFTSWQFAAQALAAVLATAFGAALTLLLTDGQMERWGWRIPFVFGAAMGPIAYWLRRRLVETAPLSPSQPASSPLRQTFTIGRSRLLMAFGLVACGTVSNYTLLYMPTFAVHELALPASDGFAAGFVVALLQIVAIPVAGHLSDRWERWGIALAGCGGILIVSYPLFAWLVEEPSFQRLLTAQLVLGMLASLYGGAVAVLMADLFGAATRTTGVAVSYSLSVSVVGGLAPFINEWAVDVSHNLVAPSWYLAIAAGTSLAALVAANKAGCSDRLSRVGTGPAPSPA